MITKTTCELCGTGITAITYRLYDGYCVPCRDWFPGVRGTKALLAPVGPAEVEAELAGLQGPHATVTRHHWQRISARLEPGDKLLRFQSDLQSPLPVLHYGVVWRRAGQELSGVVTRTEWLLVEEEMWLGNAVRFATQDEVAACPAIRDNLRAQDRVLHYRNNDPEGIAEDGREGFVVVRNRRCAMRVRIERSHRVRAERRDVAQLEFGLAG